MNQQRVDEIRKRLEMATKGEWVAISDLPAWAVSCEGKDVVGSESRRYASRHTNHIGSLENDAAFIAHSKQDVAYLLTLV